MTDVLSVSNRLNIMVLDKILDLSRARPYWLSVFILRTITIALMFSLTEIGKDLEDGKMGRLDSRNKQDNNKSAGDNGH